MNKNLNLLKIIRRYLPVVVANTSVAVFASDVVIVVLEKMPGNALVLCQVVIFTKI